MSAFIKYDRNEKDVYNGSNVLWLVETIGIALMKFIRILEHWSITINVYTIHTHTHTHTITHTHTHLYIYIFIYIDKNIKK